MSKCVDPNEFMYAFPRGLCAFPWGLCATLPMSAADRCMIDTAPPPSDRNPERIAEFLNKVFTGTYEKSEL